MKIMNIIDAQRYLYKFTPNGAQQIYSGGMALERPREFYSLLGNPQNSYKVIHIAGTSGKGSTCHYISYLLQAHGFQVGLSISPHLYDIRERLQINNSLISEKDFCEYLNEIIPALEKMKDTKYGFPTYFEIMQGMAFYTFMKKKVEYAVMETGLGGRFDPTNTVTRDDKVAVITKIGFDHQHILGNTLPKIALEKAKIIQQKNIALSIEQKPQIEKVINKEALAAGTKVEYLRKEHNFKNIQVNEKGVILDFQFGNTKLDSLQLSSFGLFQAENVSLALATITKLSKRDKFVLAETQIREALQLITIEGRMQFVRYKSRNYLLDGAHNSQKMLAFTKSLQKLYPQKKLTFIVGFKKRKNTQEMLKYIIPLAGKIIISQFVSDTKKQLELDKNISKVDALKVQGYPSTAVEPEQIANTLKKLNFSNFVITQSIDQALKVPVESVDTPVIITGSLYLIGNVLETLK